MIDADADPEHPIRHRVLLVDDHPAIRMGLTALIDAESDLEVCGEAEDVVQAIDEIKVLHPDIAVVDLTLTNSSGLDLIKNIQGQAHAVPILVLSMHDEALFAEQALRAGAQGYIIKREAMSEVLMALRKILQGEIYLSTQMTTRLLRKTFKGGQEASAHPLAALSDRELEVLQLMGQGCNRHDITTSLHISIKTVETHRSHLMDKLHLENMTELTRYALYWSTDPIANESRQKTAVS